jgi:hypothetical protein
MLIDTISITIIKLGKYFPRKLSKLDLIKFKPNLFSIILELRFKILHFKDQGLLSFYPSIIKDILFLFKEEYLR